MIHITCTVMSFYWCYLQIPLPNSSEGCPQWQEMLVVCVQRRWRNNARGVQDGEL